MILNEEQLKAVNAPDENIFLLASAGSGKTRVIIERIKTLIKNNVDPSKIVALTFTKKAADEMKERLNNDFVTVKTFHSYCLSNLMKNQDIKLYDDEESIPFKEMDLLKISLYKNHLYRIKKPNIYDKYQNFLKDNNLIDYDDLLILYLESLRHEKPDIKYLFIDEFQDTNKLQFEILKNLKKSIIMFAVGDPDQSIYRFRGASELIIRKYIKQFNAKLLTLKINYRSTTKIIDCANALIRHNKTRIKKEMIAAKKEEGIICYYSVSNTTLEARKVLDLIFYLRSKNINEIAVMYRNHKDCYQVMLLLNENNLLSDKRLSLLTFHQSKGLEFEAVILIGLANPVLRENRISELEEERRLFFVAVTRAKNVLFLISSRVNHDEIYQKPSKFIKELKVRKTKDNTQTFK